MNASRAASPSVPWRTVVPLAALLAAADCFWVVTLRGAVGAIERSSPPFAAWLRETTLLLPLFGLGVLVALAAAHGWYGARPRGARAVFVSLGLVWLAGTVAGVAVLLASTAYDYHLEIAGLAHMSTVHDSCGAPCLTDGIHATGRQQLLAVLVGAGLIAATNVVVVGYLVCLWGGRVVTATLRPLRRQRPDDLRLVLACGLAGAAVIHAAVVPEHWEEWPLAGAFFAVLTLAELGGAGTVARRPSRTALGAAVVLSAGPLLLWTVSRTTGLPFGPEAGTPEGVGMADAGASLLELMTLVLAVRLLTSRGRPRPLARHLRAASVTAVLALTTIGVGGSGLSAVHAFGVRSHADHEAGEVAP